MKTKTILLLISILIIGIAIGFLSSGYLMRARVKSFNRLESATQLEQRIFDILELSPEAKQSIGADVSTFSSAYSNLRKETKREMRRKADSLNQSLFQKLDEEQIKKLKNKSRIFGGGRKEHRSGKKSAK